MIFAAAGCIPVPVSTVLLHPREERSIALESALTDNYGTFSSPAFDASGALIAAYDSGSDLVRIFRSSDLAPVDSLKPKRRPRRLSFSPGGHFLIIEAYQGWIDDYVSNNRVSKGASTSHIEIDSPEAVRDDIQRVEIWNLQDGRTIPDLSCDAVAESSPQGGWLWARQWAITPGSRSSALLAAHFSADETELSMLCLDGVRQRWDTRTWERLESIPPPPFWDALLAHTTANWLAGDAPVSRSADGRTAVLRVREKNFGFPKIYIWDQTVSRTRQLPGECASRLQPAYALSRDGSRIVTVCNKGLGYSIRVWDLGSGNELSLRNSDFGSAGGYPNIRSEGVALSPDGRYLAVALLGQMEALLPNVLLIPAGIDRSDLRLWNVDNGKELVSVPIDDLNAGADYFRGIDVAFSPDSSTLAVCGRRLRVYRLSDLAANPR